MLNIINEIFDNYEYDDEDFIITPHIEEIKELLIAEASQLEPFVMLRSIAKQLNSWAEESRTGGWSTHQVKPMQDKAAEIYRLLNRMGFE